MIAKRRPLRRALPRFVTETQRGLHTTCALGGASKQGARSRQGERATTQLRAAAPASLSPASLSPERLPLRRPCRPKGTVFRPKPCLSGDSDTGGGSSHTLSYGASV